MKKLLVLLICICLFTGYYFCYLPIVNAPTGAILLVKPGLTKDQFVSDLAQQQALPFPTFAKFLLRLDAWHHLKAGEYHLPNRASLSRIWWQVSRGRGVYLRELTIVPGSSWAEVVSACDRSDLHHVIHQFSKVQIQKLIDPNSSSLEGAFYPETYYYTHGETDLAALKRAHQLMQKILSENWANRTPNLPYKNVYEALIAASLIEKEAFYPAEQPLIAGVLVNRLRKQMLLQFDPTVIYAVGDDYHKQLTKVDLLNPNPYNTYVHKGLPPTPIANPGKGAIVAALHPAVNDYLYFVASGGGHHQFSTSLLAHHVAVENAKANLVKSLPTQASKDYIHWPTLEIKSLPSSFATGLIMHEAR